ncbi:MAG: BTAD domain-containing putative transcriptional regulator [Chloroflexota bacterium]
MAALWEEMLRGLQAREGDTITTLPPQSPLRVAIGLLYLLNRDYGRARARLAETEDLFRQGEEEVERHLRSVLEGWQGSQARASPADELTGESAPCRQRTAEGHTLAETEREKDTTPEWTTLRVFCLGKFLVYQGEKPIDLGQNSKAKTLLKYLVAHRRPLPREVLIETLWPDSDPQAANNRLKVALHALRQALAGSPNSRGIDYILYQDGSYSLNPQIGLWVDAEAFEGHCQAGQRLEMEGKSAEAMRHYALAEDLYRGNYLEEDPYEEWTLIRREALKDLYLTILGRLSDYAMEMGEYTSCILRSQKILANDPCREDAYRQLMRCYSRVGQRSQALHWYDLCVKTLRKELAITPEAATTELYHKLRREEEI